MNKNFTIKTGQTQEQTLTIRRVVTLITLFFLTQTFVQANAFLDVTVVTTDASCGGGNDGTATAQPTNGWAPFTYLWSNGETTQTITGLAPGTYSVTVTDVDLAIAIGSGVVGQSGGIDLFMSASYETCPGSADGTASVNAFGGVEPYSYEWSTGETFVVASGLSAGTYTVTVTDANGCSAVGSVTVELSPEGIWLMPTATNTDCGLANGTAYANVMTGVAPYTFLWSDGQTTETAVGLAAGVYSVTVTDSNGCTNSASVTVESNSDLDISLSGTDAVCGLSNGSATVSVNGGTAPFTYEWSTGATTATINDLSAGTYSVTVTDVDGCSNAGSITINDQGGLEIMVTGTDANCNNSDGTASVSATGGTPSYGYMWSNGATTASISGLAPGTYGVTVTDANGCGATGSVTIGGSTVDGGFIITNDNTHICVGDGSDDIIDVTLTGNIGSNSKWLITSPSLDILGVFDSPPFNFETAPPGVCVIWHISYEGTITGLEVGLNAANLSGCFDLSNSIEVLRQNCCDLDGGDISTNDDTNVCVGDGIDDLIDVTLTGASPAANQAWIITDQAGNILALPPAPPFNFEGAGEGVCLIWSISYESGLTGLEEGENVADLDGCYALSNQSIVITRNPSPTITLDGGNATCDDAGDGTISVNISGGTAPYSYLWSTGATSASLSGLSPGTYSVTVTDANGCSDSGSTTIGGITIEGGDISTSDNTSICAGDGVDDLVDVTLTGASAGTTQAWVITDQAGNILDLPAAPPFNFEGAGAGVCLIWSISYLDGLTGLTVGANVANLQGCYALSNQSIAVTRNPSPTITLDGSNATCDDAGDGTISVNISGGTAPYSYLWSTGATSASLSGLAPGNYSVTVTDDNGCSDSGSTTIGGITIEGGDISTNDNTSICAGDGVDDLVDVTLTGASAGTTQAWVITDQAGNILDLPVAPPFNFEGAGAGVCLIWSINYLDGLTGLTVGANVANLQGCYALSNQSIAVTRYQAPSISLTGTDASCSDASDGSITVDITGGTAPFSYLWSTGATSASLSGLAPGTYSVTVTDDNGCTDSGSTTIGGPTIGGGDITTNDNTTVCAGDGVDDLVDVTLTGASAGTTQAWVITDQAGNILDLPVAPPFNFEGAGAGVCLIWSISYLDGLSGLTVGANVANLQGCYALSNQSIAVTRYQAPSISLTGTDASCSDASDGSITVDITGGTAPFSYLWSTGATSASLSGLAPGTYSVTVTDDNGCTDSGSATIEGFIIEGGDLSTSSNTTICAGDGIDDLINVNLSGSSAGLNQSWIITDQAGNILALPAGPPFNLEGAGAGVCLIWSISYLDGLTGLMVGENVTDLTGCYALSSQSIEVIRYLAPTISLNGTNVSCNGAADGTITVNITDGTAPFSYLWSTGSSSASLSGLAPGTYGVTVTDANGCSDDASITITEPPSLGITFNSGEETCVGSADGFAEVIASGGTLPYSYLWSNGATTALNSGLGAGTYGVTVTDANGCEVANSTAVTIITNGITSCSAAVTSSYNEGVDISTFGGSDGSAAVNVFGGTAPLSYLWSNGQTGASASGLSAGTYTVDITDANGCTCSADVTLVDPSKAGNFVWEDDNRNGIQDAGEPGIGGVAVSLTGTSFDGTPVNRATSTDSNGAYSFDGLPPGNYKVTFDAGAILKRSPQGSGSDGTVDSDMNEDTGMTDFFDLGVAECNNDIDAGFYECVTIGDFVFYDGNRDGIQQPWEAGVANIPVLLQTTGPDGIYCNEDDVFVDGATTANNGRYYFECVEPGQYYITFGVNTSDYFFTDKNVGGDDELDSDANPMTGKTDLFTVTEGQADDLSYDAGIYLICEDFNTGGQIGYSQDLCFGEPADPIVSVSLPLGGFGDAEYLWLKSTLGGSLTNGSWSEIPNNDSPTYDPGFLNTTTFFIRCARRENCDNFVAESNIVVIEVSSCGNSGFLQDLTADVMASSRIALHWSTEPENGLYRYHIERSADAIDFDAIGSMEGLGNQQSMNRYEFMDNTPRIGRNLYRVLRENLSTGELMYSNTVEAVFNPNEKQFFVYPNPTRNELFVESVFNMNGNATLELYSATGQLLEVVYVNPQLGTANIDFSRYASGPYFIKVILEDKDEFEIIRIVKE